MTTVCPRGDTAVATRPRRLLSETGTDPGQVGLATGSVDAVACEAFAAALPDPSERGLDCVCAGGTYPTWAAAEIRLAPDSVGRPTTGRPVPATAGSVDVRVSTRAPEVAVWPAETG